MRILIADDDSLIRTFISVCLQDIAEICQASDGPTAMKMLKQGGIDLLLLDWSMPAPDGLTVLKTIRGQGIKIPVIMVTGEAGRSQVVEALNAGASDYLVKPFEAVPLRAKVEKFCKAKC